MVMVCPGQKRKVLPQWEHLLCALLVLGHLEHWLKHGVTYGPEDEAQDERDDCCHPEQVQHVSGEPVEASSDVALAHPDSSISGIGILCSPRFFCEERMGQFVLTGPL